MNPKILYISGLPRAGSTLLCQLLGLHPHIYSIGHSSPLCNVINTLREKISDDPFLLAQLDVDFDLTYQRLFRSTQAFMHAWFQETDALWAVDKNRGWLMAIETLKQLDPDFRMVVCLRELTQVLGSIETQHQKTILLDFPDHVTANAAYTRASKLFASDGVIGGPLHALDNLQDYDQSLMKHIAFISFEQLVTEPQASMDQLLEWLGLETIKIDINHLPVKRHESDSYYRFKYPHATRVTLKAPPEHVVSKRIIEEIHSNFRWYYEQFYPHISLQLKDHSA